MIRLELTSISSPSSPSSSSSSSPSSSSSFVFLVLVLSSVITTAPSSSSFSGSKTYTKPQKHSQTQSCQWHDSNKAISMTTKDVSCHWSADITFTIWRWKTLGMLLTSKMAVRAAGVTWGQMEVKTVLQTCLMWRLGWDSRDNKMSTITSTQSGPCSSSVAAAGTIHTLKKHLTDFFVTSSNLTLSTDAINCIYENVKPFLSCVKLNDAIIVLYELRLHLVSSSSSWISSPGLGRHSSAGPSWCPAAPRAPSEETHLQYSESRRLFYPYSSNFPTMFSFCVSKMELNGSIL